MIKNTVDTNTKTNLIKGGHNNKAKHTTRDSYVLRVVGYGYVWLILSVAIYSVNARVLKLNGIVMLICIVSMPYILTDYSQ